MPPARRQPLKPGRAVWFWYGGVVCRGTVERRGVTGFAMTSHWRVRLDDSGFVLYFQRRRLFLCREDAANALR